MTWQLNMLAKVLSVKAKYFVKHFSLFMSVCFYPESIHSSHVQAVKHG